MIRCYTGVPGSGKSLHSIRVILDYLKAGKNVIANFPLNMDLLKEKEKLGRYFFIQNDEITVEYLIQFSQMFHNREKENQTLLIIDEASIKFNCRTFNDKDRLPFLTFFAQHRKYGFNVVLVAQDLRQIDRQIRNMVELELVHRKLNNFSFFRSLPFPLFVFIERNKACNNEKNESEYFLFSKRYSNLYDTFYDFSGVTAHPENLQIRKQIVQSEIIIPEKTRAKKKIFNLS